MLKLRSCQSFGYQTELPFDILYHFFVFVKNGVAKIKRNSKIFYIIFGVIDVLLLLATVFLLAAALLFRGGSAPALFGHYVFLAETDAFSAVKKGSALIVDPVELTEIAPGNIIIFTDEEGGDRIGEVQTVASDDGIYTFTVRNDANNNVTVGQSHIVGKGIYYSEFVGAVVSFATSPAGVCLIAILPCAAFVIFEIVGIVKRRAPQPEVDTVKKQYETPTYVPPSRKTEPLDEDDLPAFSPDRQRLVEAAGLFTQPARKPEPPPKPVNRSPISGRDIDKLIRETKARHEREAFAAAEAAEPRAQQSRAAETPEPQPQHSRAAAVAAYRANAADNAEVRPGIELTPDDEKPHNVRKETVERPRERTEETVKRYVPPKVKYVPRVNRLDSLLRDDSIDGDSQFDIDDILKNFETRGQ